MRPSELTPVHYPRVLSIAGSDSGGGAGIQADLKTFAALGCYGMTALTALTAQNTQGVRAIHGVPLAMLCAQIDAVAEDLGVDAVKVGMLHSAQAAQAVAQAIARHALAPVVFDPVMVASSGTLLMDQAAIAVLVRELFPLVTVITPNLDEAAVLVGRALHTEADMLAAATELLALGARAVVLKGGHLQGDTVSNLLMPADGQAHWVRAPRIATRNSHGTGCTLSSAMAAYLALGHPLVDAVARAHAFVHQALQAGAGVRTGHGVGPMNHGFAPQPLRPLIGPRA